MRAPQENHSEYFPPTDGATGNIDSFPLTVLYTTVTGTLSALRKAAQLANELGAHIQILIPHVVPYPLPLDKPSVSPNFRLRQFQTVCAGEPVDTSVDIRLCRDAKQCIKEALSPHSIVVIAAPQTWWPFSSEKRLAKRLAQAGHHVVLVEDSAAD